MAKLIGPPDTHLWTKNSKKSRATLKQAVASTGGITGETGHLAV
jgi:hypothetical protein